MANLQLHPPDEGSFQGFWIDKEGRLGLSEKLLKLGGCSKGAWPPMSKNTALKKYGLRVPSDLAEAVAIK
ncbi:MAG: hypothetical protein OSA93_06405 [Akkermansiaceae bacterium]|nr:hypothetical protein [Akkermansiaceae bacterium]